MDVALHPDFADNRLVYLSYGKPSANDLSGTTTVVRARLEGNRLIDVEEISESDAWGTTTITHSLLGEDGVRPERLPVARRGGSAGSVRPARQPPACSPTIRLRI